MKNKLLSIWPVLLLLLVQCSINAENIIVSDSSELKEALSKAKAETGIILKPGKYIGGIYLKNVSGDKEKPVVIRGADPNDPAVFSGGGSEAFHFSDCNYIKLANLKVIGYSGNGINIDDGGSFDSPCHHVTLENIAILRTGPEGNHDALKMSGVDNFIVRDCYFEGWGGSGIDMVGCHEGIVTGCEFVGREDFSQSNAVQLKGGTCNILVEKCLFKNTGHRSVNLGGSTGLQFFRPEVRDYEARDITIAGNRFVGSVAPLAWVTADGGHVHHNTIVFPEKWILRILQETKDDRFRRCHSGIFEKNLVVFDSRVNVFVNVGPETNADSFVFGNNGWIDIEGNRKPVLPVPEQNGIYQLEILNDKSRLEDGIVCLKDAKANDIGAKSYRKIK